MHSSSRALRVTPRLTIPLDEIEISASPHGGPGGQHANRSATRVEVRFSISRSSALSGAQKDRLREVLASRLMADATLRTVSGRERSQLQNRRAALERLAAILAAALRPRPQRTPTVPTTTSKQTRLENKKRRGATKRERQLRPTED